MKALQLLLWIHNEIAIVPLSDMSVADIRVRNARVSLSGTVVTSWLQAVDH